MKNRQNPVNPSFQPKASSSSRTIRLRVIAGVAVIGMVTSFVTVARLTLTQDPADAVVTPVNWNGTWDCSDTLYAVKEGNGAPTSQDGGGWKIDSVTSVAPGAASFNRFFYQTAPVMPGSTTLAIGPDPSNANTMTGYFWAYGNINISKLPQGATVPVPLGDPPGLGSQMNQSGGGEVNQTTGQIYMSGLWDGTITSSGGSARVAIVEPTATSSTLVAVSGPLRPAGQSLQQLVPGTGNWILSSDMAIDGEGSAYMLAAASNTGPWALLKVVPNLTGQPGDWLYSVVRLFPSGSGLTGNANAWWGMAFINGMIYLYNSTNEELFRVNALTGVIERMGTRVGLMRDLAACQIAPVLNGTVYIDIDGDGSTDGPSNVLKNAAVEIYNSAGARIGATTTNDLGQYSFLLNSANTDFYIAVRQPVIDGVNAAQTYASSRTSGFTNRVIPLCSTGPTGDYAANTSGGTCAGARYDQIDPSTTPANVLAAAGGAAFVTRVEMRTPAEVATADFAFTAAASHGDAPYKTLIANQGPSHIQGSVHGAKLFLGSAHAANTAVAGPVAPTDQTDPHGATDDGVEIDMGGGNWRTLKEAIGLIGKTYPIRVAVGGSQVTSTTQVQGWGGALVGSPPTSPNATSIFTGSTISMNNSGSVSGGFATGSLTTGSGQLTGVAPTWARFRVTPKTALSATDIPPYPPAAASTDANTESWWVPGEVEDYRMYVALGTLTLRAKSAGGPARFTFSLGNISNAAPSSNSDSIDATGGGAVSASTNGHVFANIGQDVTITPNIPPPVGYSMTDTECTRATATGSVSVPTTTSGGVVTIPASEIAQGVELTCTVSFAQQIDTGTSTLTVTPTTSQTVGVGTFTATATARAVDSSTLTGVKVRFNLDPTSGATINDPLVGGQYHCETNSSGQCSVTISGATAGQYRVSATGLNLGTTSNWQPIGTQQTFAYTFNPATCSPSLTTSPTTPQVVGTAFTGTVSLTDGLGNPCTGLAGSLAAQSAPADVTFGSFTEGTPGQYTFSINSTGSGSKALTVTHTRAGGSTAQATGQVEYQAGPPATLELSVSPTNLRVTEPATITATVKDASGNLTNGTVRFSTTAPVPGGPTQWDVPTTAGVATQAFTSNIVGTYTATASVVNTPGVSVVPPNVTVVFNPGPACGPTITLEAAPATGVPADGTSSHTATVTVRDCQNNLIPQAPVLFTLSGIGSITNPGATSSTWQGQTGSAGTVALTVVSQNVTGAALVSAQYGDPGSTPNAWVQNSPTDASRKVLSMDFISTAVASGTYEVRTPSATNVVADGQQVNTVWVRLKDASGTPVKGSGDLIDLDVRPGPDLGMPPPATPITVTESTTTDGLYIVTIASRKAGVFTAGGKGAGFQLTKEVATGAETIRFVPGSASSATLDVPVRVAVEANGTATQLVRVVVLDANGNGVPGATFNAIAQLQGVTPPQFAQWTTALAPVNPTAVPFAGVYEGAISATTAGTYAVTATVTNATPPVVTTSAPPLSNLALFAAGPPCTSPLNSTLAVAPASAQVTNNVTATASLKDCRGNDVPNWPVRFSTSPAIALPGGGLANTGAAGTAQSVFTTQTANTYQVSYDILDQSGTTTLARVGPQPVTFTNGPCSASHAVLSSPTDGGQVPPNGSHVATVQLRDQFNNPCLGYPNSPVTFALSGVGSVDPTTPATGVADPATGQYSIRVVSPSYRVGQTTVQATTGSPGTWIMDPATPTQRKTLNLGFANTLPPCPAESSFTVSTGSQRANGTDAHKVTVVLKTCPPSVPPIPMSGEAARLSALAVGVPGQGDAIVMPFTEVVGTPGTYEAEITSLFRGDKTVSTTWNKGQATEQNIAPADPARRTVFFDGVWDAARLTLTPSPATPQVANGQDTYTVTATVTDPTGQAITAGGVGAQTSATGVTVSPVASGSSPGVYTFTVASTAIGGQTVRATFTPPTPPSPAVPVTADITLPFIAANPDPSRTTLAVSPASLTVGAPTTATVSVNDNLGHPVEGANVTLTVVDSSGAPIQPVGTVGWTGTTGPSGVFTVPFSTHKADRYAVTASITRNGVTISPAAQPQYVTFNAGAVSMTNTRLTSATDGQTKLPNTEEHSATVTVRDQWNNPVPNARVEFFVPGASFTITPALASNTDANGMYTIQIKSSRVAVANVTAAVIGNQVVDPQGSPASLNLAFDTAGPCAGGNYSYYTLTPTGTQPVGSGQFTIRAHLETCAGVPVINKEQNLNATATGRGTQGNGIVGSFVEDPQVAGEYTATITSQKSGIKDVAVQWVPASQAIAPQGGLNTVEFTALDTPSWTNSYYSVSTLPNVVANGTAPQYVYVHLADQYDNPIPGAQGKLSGRATNQLATVGTFTENGPNDPGNYTAPVTSTAAGAHPIEVVFKQTPTATEQSVPRGGGGQANINAAFVPGAASPTMSSFTLTPPSLQVGNTVTVTVQARDGNGTVGNPVPGQVVRLAISPATDPATPAASLTGTTGASGTVTLTFTSNKVNTHQVRAYLVSPSGTETEIQPAASPTTVSFTAGPPSPVTSTFQVGTDTAPANGQNQIPVTVTLLDSFSNPVGGKQGQLTIGPDGATASQIGAGSALGTYTAALTATQARDYTVSVRFAEGANAFDVAWVVNRTAKFTAGPGDPARSVLRVSATTAPAGDSITASVAALDTPGNPPEGQVVEFWTDPLDPIRYADPTATFLRAQTDRTGLASVRLSTTKAGTYTVYARLVFAPGTQPAPVSNSGAIKVDFTPRGPDPAQTRLTGSTGNVHSDTTAYHWARVTVRDQYRNPLFGQPVAFTLTDPASPTGTPIGQLVPGYSRTGTTNASGEFEARWVGNYRLGTTDVGANVGPMTVTETDGTTPAKLRWTWITGTATTTLYQLTSGDRLADGKDTHTVTVRLLDASNGPVVGEASNLRLQLTQASGAPDQPSGAGWSSTGFTEPSPGVYTATVASTWASTFDVAVSHGGATVPPDPATVPNRTTLVFRPGQMSPSQSWFEVSAGPVRSDGSSFHTLTATIRDINGNPIPGGSLQAQPSTGQGVTVAPFQYGAGVYTTQLRSTTPGAYTMTTTFAATAGGASTGIGHVDPQGQTRNAIAIFRNWRASAVTSTIKVQTPHVVEANGTDRTTAIVTLKDDNGDPLGTAGTGVSVIVQPSIGSASPATDNGDGTYTAVLTSTAAGKASVGFELAGAPSQSHDAVTFVPTPAPPSLLDASATQVSGTADPGNTIRILDSTGAVMCTTQVGPDGHFTCDPLTPPARDGEALTVTSSVGVDGRVFTSSPALVTADAPRTPSARPTTPPPPPPPDVVPTRRPSAVPIPPVPSAPYPGPGRYYPVPKTGGGNVVAATCAALGVFSAGLLVLLGARRRRDRSGG
ncbi:MAG: Ig-like domain-containing protein [Bifidobacteriaceae bacterium]|nr:Ig-like domain-containing protein [Bifidobacteriaceae bacterium]